MNIAVVGLGKLGLPLAALLSEAGHTVVGIDVDDDVAAAAAAGAPLVPEPEVAELLAAHPLALATTDWAAAGDADVVFVIVPTPSLATGAFDNSYVIDAVTAVGEHLDDGALVVIASTVSPGSVDGPIREALETAVGDDQSVGLAYNPQFIALGSVIHDMRHPDFVLIGTRHPAEYDTVASIARTIAPDAPIKAMSPVNAEIVKIGVNAFITMKATFANVLADLAELHDGGNAWIVADAIGTDSRIGRKFLRPGTKVGGPCLPRDSAAFAAAAPDVGAASALATAVDRINSYRTFLLAGRVIDRLTERGFAGRLVGILGLAYKPGTPVTEEAAGADLAARLRDSGIPVVAYDPNVASSDELAAVLAADIVVVTTDDPAYTDIVFTKAGQLIIDCWGTIGGSQLRPGVEHEILGVRP